MRKALLIGAFERDNFGDVLFYHVTKQYLSNYETTAASIVYKPSTEYFPHEVVPYAQALDEIKYDLVWTVGGEVGGLSLGNAYGMSFDAELASRYERLSADARSTVDNVLGVGRAGNVAYMPDLKRTAKNKNTPYVLNSVGLSNIAHAPEDLSTDTLKILQDARLASVREKESMHFLQGKNIKVAMSPDVVHTVALHPDWYSHSSEYRPIPDRFILLQLNESIVKKYGVRSISKMIVEVNKGFNCPIKLFAAGTARRHDSIELYEKIMKEANAMTSAKRIVDIVATRNAVDLMHWIKDCYIWIGTSLHGRILSASFNKPRVSLENRKVAMYCNTWDERHPFNIALHTESVMTGMHTALDLNEDKKVSNNLAYMAEKGIEKILAKVESRR